MSVEPAWRAREHARRPAARPTARRSSRPRRARRRWRCRARPPRRPRRCGRRSSASCARSASRGEALQPASSVVRSVFAPAPAGLQTTWRAKCGASCSPDAADAVRARSAAPSSARLARSAHAQSRPAPAACRTRAAATFAGAAFGARTQRRGDRRLLARSSPMAPCRTGLRQRATPDDLAAKRHEVEIRLEDLLLAPACARAAAPPTAWLDLLRRRCGRRRAAPGRRRCRPVSCIVIVDAPRVRVFHRLRPRARRPAPPVDAAVLVEALVLRRDDRRRATPARSRASATQAPRRAVVSMRTRLQRLAVAIEQQRRRSCASRARTSSNVGGAACARRAASRHAERARARVMTSLRGVTAAPSTGAFGDSPNISGAYSASTRVGGSAEACRRCSAAPCTRPAACPCGR